MRNREDIGSNSRQYSGAPQYKPSNSVLVIAGPQIKSGFVLKTGSAVVLILALACSSKQ